MFGKKKKHNENIMLVKAAILIILGVALWRGLIGLDVTVAILLVLAGIKMLLVPHCCKK